MYGIGGKSCNRTLAAPESWADSDGSEAACSGNLCTYAVDERSCNKALHAGHRGVRYGETRCTAIALWRDAVRSGYIHVRYTSRTMRTAAVYNTVG